jgi:hypothetical protein
MFSLLWHVSLLNRSFINQVMLLCETGQCQLEHMQKANQWMICKDSRCSTWLIWLRLQSVSEPNDYVWIWVFRDQVAEGDFRRISRVVQRSQQTHSLITK